MKKATLLKMLAQNKGALFISKQENTSITPFLVLKMRKL